MQELLFRTELLLPRPRNEVFPFFAEARNLEEITPPWLHFELTTPEPLEMNVGTLIDYRIRIHGFPIHWRTKIEVWEPPHRFVDLQLKGPYRLWHHTHTFEDRGPSTLCRDEVRYWPLGGALIDALFVRRDVQTIFAYRARKLRERFG